MSFQDPPRHQRSARYPAFPEDQDGYPSYRQRPPWDDDLPRQSAWDTGARQELRETGSQPSVWDTGTQPSVWDTSAQRALRNSGTQHLLRESGAHRAPRNSGELPRRTSGAFQAAPARNGLRRSSRGLLAGGITGFLAAAVAIGIANLVAAFVRPQASPIIAVGGAFIDRTPSALKNFAVEKFGENDKNMLLLGMYVTIALIAIAIGIFAWRRAAIGVAGIGLFGLFGAFVAITRPESHVTDVIPSIVGGIAGIATILWLVRTGMPRRPRSWVRGR
jgi:hypothetical protein